jgi:DHA1 family multidrug resistance protein-like MFS transporter
MFAFSQFLFSPLAGDLSDKYGRKYLIIIGLVIFGLSQLLFGLASELWVLFLARFFSGVGSAFLVPPMMAFVADITTVEDRGKGMGLLGASMSLGFMIGPAIGGFLAEVSLQFPFFVATSAALVSATVSIFVLPNTKPLIVQPGMERKRENLFKQMKRSTTTPYFIMLIVMFVFSFGLANFQATISLYVDKKYGFTPGEIAIIITGWVCRSHRTNVCHQQTI